MEIICFFFENYIQFIVTYDINIFIYMIIKIVYYNYKWMGQSV